MAGAKLVPALEIPNQLLLLSSSSSKSTSSSSTSRGAQVTRPRHHDTPKTPHFLNLYTLSTTFTRTPRGISVAASSSSSSSPMPSAAPTKLFISGLSFRTTEESLRNAFQKFGELVDVNLVMDRVANRPRGFAFVRYSSDEESKKAIEGMHGKFLDGRVIFVEVAKSKSELRQDLKERPQIQ